MPEIIKPKVEIEKPYSDGRRILKDIERYGRACYKSEHGITETSARKFLKKAIKGGHFSIIEHEKVTAKIICDRGVSHEIVRHRLASYSRESTSRKGQKTGWSGLKRSQVWKAKWSKN